MNPDPTHRNDEQSQHDDERILESEEAPHPIRLVCLYSNEDTPMCGGHPVVTETEEFKLIATVYDTESSKYLQCYQRLNRLLKLDGDEDFLIFDYVQTTNENGCCLCLDDQSIVGVYIKKILDTDQDKDLRYKYLGIVESFSEYVKLTYFDLLQPIDTLDDFQVSAFQHTLNRKPSEVMQQHSLPDHVVFVSLSIVVNGTVPTETFPVPFVLKQFTKIQVAATPEFPEGAEDIRFEYVVHPAYREGIDEDGVPYLIIANLRPEYGMVPPNERTPEMRVPYKMTELAVTGSQIGNLLIDKTSGFVFLHSATPVTDDTCNNDPLGEVMQDYGAYWAKNPCDTFDPMDAPDDCAADMTAEQISEMILQNIKGTEPSNP